MLAGATALASFVAPVAVAADAAAAARQAACTTPHVLPGSNFEIDTNANLIVNGGGDCIDWLDRGTNNLRSDVLKKFDKPSGSNDDSFVQGTSENDANPTIGLGSIPPNKSDLTTFGVHTETSTAQKFLELFWRRQNVPSGTTNMDFELNQKFCDTTMSPSNCANNGPTETATPIRTVGDKLITYDLAQGGTVPTISIRTWNGSAWGPASVISGGANPTALGSVNSTSIPASQADALGFPPPPSGSATSLDPFTFGEAAISYNAIFPTGGACTSFGSAYVKSRASTSFSAELKDFIAPERVQITNCSTLTTLATASATVGTPIHDTATLAGTSGATGTITFNLFGNAQCSGMPLATSTRTVTGNTTYTSDAFTPTSTGTYYWTAAYSGDANNSPAQTACGDPGESTVVNPTRPTITTLLSPSTITVDGTASDTATLTGATSDAGGTVTYNVFDNAGCAGTPRDAGTVTVTNGNVPPSNSLQFTSTGTFYWQATYSGDANNGAAQSTCSDEPLTVNRAPANISTAQHIYPQDSATVTASAGGTPQGNVTFNLYGPGDPGCTGMPVHTETVALDANGQATTSNSTFSVDAAHSGDYKWEVTYDPDNVDTTHSMAKSVCGTEHTTINVSDQP